MERPIGSHPVRAVRTRSPDRLDAMSELFGLRASPWFNLDKHRGDSPSVIRFAPHSRDSPRVRGDDVLSRNVKGALAPVKRGHSVAINIAPDECIPSPNNKEYLWDP